MHIQQLNTLLTYQNSLKGIETANNVRKNILAHNGILETEIKISRGDTSDKQQALAAGESKAASLNGVVGNSLADLNNNIANDAVNEKTSPSELSGNDYKEKADGLKPDGGEIPTADSGIEAPPGERGVFFEARG